MSSDPTTSPDDELKRWGKLRLLKRLGTGAFGDVYLAHDPDLDRDVALKLFRRPSGVRPPRPAPVQDDLDPTATSAPSRAGSVRGREAMVREGRLLARVRHPNIAVIYGADEIDGRVGIWMDYVRGRTLHDLVREQGRFGPQEAALIGLDLCRALAAVHGCGLIHRDVKAQNVMREEGGRTVLMDFGVGVELPSGAARVTDLPSGTPQYMAPEVLLQGITEPASDQYSLGVLLFFLVTGEFPIASVSLEELTEKLRRGERRSLRDVRPDLPMSFIEVVERALEGDPPARYAGMGEMERALTAVIGSGSPRLREVALVPKGEAATETEGWRTGLAVSGATLAPGAPAAMGPARGFSVRLAVMIAVIILALGTAAGVLLWQNHLPRSRGVPIPKQITFDGQSSFGEISPDGKSVFCITFDEDSTTCWLQDLYGGAARALYRVPGETKPWTSARWDPDGSRVLFGGLPDTCKTGIYEIKKNGGAPTRLAELSPYFAASPDGQRIVSGWQNWEGHYALTDLRSGHREERLVEGRVGWLCGIDWGGPQGQILVVDVDKDTGVTTLLAGDAGSSEMTALYKDSADVTIANARWAPTQNAVYCLRATTANDANLVKIASFGNGSRVASHVLLSGLNPEHFSVSEDGRRIVLTRRQSYSNLWVLTPDGNQGRLQVRRLTAGRWSDHGGQVSPDGHTVAFVRTTDREQVYTIPIQGGRERLLTPTEKSGISSPSWSPDGRNVAYLGKLQDTVRVCVVPAEGGKPRILLTTRGSSELTWGKDGKILYQQPGNRNFHILDPISEGERPLVDVDSVGWMFHPLVSPDGRMVLVFWNRTWEGASLWLIDTVSGEERSLHTSLTTWPIGWSHDGQWIWAWDSRGSATPKVVRIPVAGGPSEAIYDFPFSREVEIVDMVTASDGSFFVASVGEDQSDIWLVENFDPDVR
jgi:Tol biopolymer transport system component